MYERTLRLSLSENSSRLKLKLFTILLTHVSLNVVDFQKQCDCYWPEKVGEEKKYGAASVKMDAEGHYADYTLRIFTLTTEVYFYIHEFYY